MMNRLIRDFDEAALGCREKYELCLQLLDWKDAVTRHRVRFSASRQIRRELAELAQKSGGEESLSLVRIAMLLGAAGVIPQYRAEEIREEQIEYLTRRLEQSATGAQASHNREILESVYRMKMVREDTHMGLMKKVGDKLGFGKKKEAPQVDKQSELEEKQNKIVEKQKAIITQIKEKTAEIRGLRIELKVTTDKNDQTLLQQKIDRLKAKRAQLQRNLDALGDVVDAQLTAILVEDEAVFMQDVTEEMSVYDDEKVDITMTRTEVQKEMKDEIKAKAKATRERLMGYAEAEEEEEFEFETESEAEEVDEIEEEEENA